MRKNWLPFCLFSFVFLVFLAGAVNETWDRYTIKKNAFIQLTGSGDTFDEFGKEIIIALAETLPDKKSFDAVCATVYLREDSYDDELLLVLYVEGDNGKDVIVWSMEKRKMKNSKAIREFAQEAVYSLLRRVGQDIPMVITPVIPPKAKITVL